MTTYTLGFTGAEIDSRLGSAGTALQPSSLSDLAQTWNDAGTTFTAIKMNVTDTASDAASLLMDLQVGGVSKFNIDKAGRPIADRYRFLNVLTSSYIASIPSPRALLISAEAVPYTFLAYFGVTAQSGIGWRTGSDPRYFDLLLARDAAGTLAQRNSTNPQTFNLYNTYTDGSNYERGFMKWNSNVLEIGTEALGTGTGRGMSLLAGDPTVGVSFNGSGRSKLTIKSDGNDPVITNDGAGAIHLNIATGAYNTRFSANGDVSFIKDGNQYINISRVGNSIFSTHYSADFTIQGHTRNIDEVRRKIKINGGAQLSTAVTNLVGGDVEINGGAGASASAGAADGGNVYVRGGTGYGTGHDGYVIMDNLPTADPVVAGAIWNDSGTLKISAGV